MHKKFSLRSTSRGWIFSHLFFWLVWHTKCWQNFSVFPRPLVKSSLFYFPIKKCQIKLTTGKGKIGISVDLIAQAESFVFWWIKNSFYIKGMSWMSARLLVKREKEQLRGKNTLFISLPSINFDEISIFFFFFWFFFILRFFFVEAEEMPLVTQLRERNELSIGSEKIE